MKHTRTDPACIHFREPKTSFQRWRSNRRRGYQCHACLRPRLEALYRRTWETLLHGQP